MCIRASVFFVLLLITVYNLCIICLWVHLRDVIFIYSIKCDKCEIYLYILYIYPNYFSSNVTLDDLAIPDTYCSNIPDAGYHCPEGMVCMELTLQKSISGFNGFDDFGKLYID